MADRSVCGAFHRAGAAVGDGLKQDSARAEDRHAHRLMLRIASVADDVGAMVAQHQRDAAHQVSLLLRVLADSSDEYRRAILAMRTAREAQTRREANRTLDRYLESIR